MRGTLINTSKTQKYFIQQRTNSFAFTAPKLFNNLPRYLRDDKSSSFPEWKSSMDELLSKVLDLPRTKNLTSFLCHPLTAKPSNSLVHWFPKLNMNNRRCKDDNNYNCYTTYSPDP